MTSEIAPASSDEMRRCKSGRSLRVLAFCLLISLGAVTAIWFSMREYRSVATMRVMETAVSEPSPVPYGSDEYFVRGQEEVIRESEEVLGPVIERYHLAPVLAPRGRALSFVETKDRLADCIEVRGIPGTDWLELSVYLRDPQLASDTANAIVESYNAYRVDQEQKSIERVLVELASEIEQQKALVERARQEMADAKARGEIVDPEPERIVPIKTGANLVSITQYEKAKALFLAQKRILEAGELKLRNELKEREVNKALSDQYELVKIGKRADPSQHGPHFDLQRIWRRYKLWFILGLIAGAALVGLSAAVAVVEGVKIRQSRETDTTTYDY